MLLVNICIVSNCIRQTLRPKLKFEDCHENISRLCIIKQKTPTGAYSHTKTPQIIILKISQNDKFTIKKRKSYTTFLSIPCFLQQLVL